MRPEILFLCHRIPYPPDKGDKIRSWNEFAFLAKYADIHLGCFIDDPADWQYTDALRQRCASSHFAPLSPALARLRSLRGIARGEALSLPYYRDGGLRRWVAKTLRHRRITAQFAFSGAMAQYVDWRQAGPKVLDLVDVDSDKWAQYAETVKGPMRRIYAREARTLATAEAEFAGRADTTILVTEPEAALLRQRAELAEDKVVAIGNGVDTDNFCADLPLPSPFLDDAPALVFTGAMDYWPNVDAAHWFATQVMPLIRRAEPRARLYIVGGNPDPRLIGLGDDPAIVVTGRVPETRAYIAQATVSIAPLRIARGIQNKVLEAMACGRAIVASPQAFEGLDAEPGRDLIVADGAPAMAQAVSGLIGDPARRAQLGRAARALAESRYRWASRLSPLLPLLGLEPADRFTPAADNDHLRAAQS